MYRIAFSIQSVNGRHCDTSNLPSLWDVWLPALLQNGQPGSARQGVCTEIPPALRHVQADCDTSPVALPFLHIWLVIRSVRCLDSLVLANTACTAPLAYGIVNIRIQQQL